MWLFQILFLFFPMFLAVVPAICYKKNSTIMQKFYLRMTFSYHCRKLYTLILLMAMILFHYTAHEMMPGEYGVMGSSVLMLVFFRFKCADKILHTLHEKRKMNFIALVTIVVFMFTPHLYTLSITVTMILLAANFYPSNQVLYKSLMPDDGMRLAKYPQTIVNYYY